MDDNGYRGIVTLLKQNEVGGTQNSSAFALESLDLKNSTETCRIRLAFSRGVYEEKRKSQFSSVF